MKWRVPQWEMGNILRGPGPHPSITLTECLVVTGGLRLGESAEAARNFLPHFSSSQERNDLASFLRAEKVQNTKGKDEGISLLSFPPFLS